MRRVLQREMTLILDEEAEDVTLLEPQRTGQCVALVTELADRFLDPKSRLRARHRAVVDDVQTVCIETPARSATSRIVGRRPCLPVIAPILARPLVAGIPTLTVTLAAC